jgi:ubiquinone/menaquinone biosynthesis C-methylase UbiE
MKKGIEQRTRAIFHRLHSDQARDVKIFDRLTKLLSQEYLQVPEDFFSDKVCLDAGCGSNANATYRMLELGAAKVYALDLDESIFKVAPKMLKEFDGRYELKVGSVLKIPYPDEFFDFTHCAGVLHHSTDVYRGLSELARVTKKGGTLFINVHGKGGIMRDLMGMLREKYRTDSAFKAVIDNLHEDQLMALWDFVGVEMANRQNNYDQSDRIPRDMIAKMFDHDLVLTIKDRIQAPLYTQSTEKELTDWLTGHGFKNIKRVSRYPQLHNIRRFLAPFYYHYDHPVARFLFGEGEPQIIATKAA